MTDSRFRLEWHLPQEPGLVTHVTLFDRERPPHYVRATGHGGDELEALIDLWSALVDRHEAEDAVELVVAAYQRRTGHPPARPGAEPEPAR